MKKLIILIFTILISNLSANQVDNHYHIFDLGDMSKELIRLQILINHNVIYTGYNLRKEVTKNWEYIIKRTNPEGNADRFIFNNEASTSPQEKEIKIQKDGKDEALLKISLKVDNEHDNVNNEFIGTKYIYTIKVYNTKSFPVYAGEFKVITTCNCFCKLYSEEDHNILKKLDKNISSKIKKIRKKIGRENGKSIADEDLTLEEIRIKNTKKQEIIDKINNKIERYEVYNSTSCFCLDFKEAIRTIKRELDQEIVEEDLDLYLTIFKATYDIKEKTYSMTKYHWPSKENSEINLSYIID
jgi:hypothetical protein